MSLFSLRKPPGFRLDAAQRFYAELLPGVGHGGGARSTG